MPLILPWLSEKLPAQKAPNRAPLQCVSHLCIQMRQFRTNVQVVDCGDSTLEGGVGDVVVLVRIAHAATIFRGYGHDTHDALTDAFKRYGNGRSGRDELQQPVTTDRLPVMSTEHDEGEVLSSQSQSKGRLKVQDWSR